MNARETSPAFQVGQTFRYEQLIDDRLVRAFADVSGDCNPIHLDEAVAGSSRFSPLRNSTWLSTYVTLPPIPIPSNGCGRKSNRWS